MQNIFFDNYMKAFFSDYKPRSSAMIERDFKKVATARKEHDQRFRSFLDKEPGAEFWAMDSRRNPDFAANPADVTVLILKALAGISKEWIAASFPNRGAVKGFKDRTVLEYSMFLDQSGISPEPDLEIPDCFHGLISSLATHQTLLGDAVAQKDPRIFADALFAYPFYHKSQKDARSLCRELLKIHAPEIDPVFQKAADYF